MKIHDFLVNDMQTPLPLSKVITFKKYISKIFRIEKKISLKNFSFIFNIPKITYELFQKKKLKNFANEFILLWFW